MMNWLDDGRMDSYRRFMHCLQKGKNDEAKSILQSNAENFCNWVDSSGSTLLHYSARYSNAVMAQNLITMGCDVNVLDNSNFTPLMLAVQNADIQTTKILLENNAHVFTKESTLKLAFYQTMNSLLIPENQLILQMLFEKVNEEFRSMSSENMEQLLLISDDLEKFVIVVFGNADLAELLLERWFSTDFQEPTRGFTALHCAMIFSRVENAKLLINYGADITLVNHFRLSPLRYYTWNFEPVDKDSSVLELCLRGSTNLYLPDQWGFNEAEYLLKWGHRKTVETVLRLGFDMIVNDNGRIRNSDGKNIAKVAELLLQHAANNEVLTCEFFIQLSFLRRHSLLLRTIIADFVLFGTLKESQLTKLVLHEIESEETFKAYFELCIQQVEKMKSVVVYGTVTLFMLLTQRQNKLVAYARNQDLVLAFKNTMTIASDMEPYYFNTLHKRVADSIERAEFEAKVASIIKTLTGLHDDAYHAIVFNIISYLDHRDLNNLCRAGSSWRNNTENNASLFFISNF